MFMQHFESVELQLFIFLERQNAFILKFKLKTVITYKNK